MTYAATGKLTKPLKALWESPSEARQSVISHAVLRGCSAADIETAMATKEWVGIRHSYLDKYGRHATTALQRDVANALTWAAGIAHQFREPQHKNKHTGGNSSHLKDRVRRDWLAHAQLWIDREFVGTRHRPVLLAVVQALAYSSALAGELVEGVPVVAVGGRSLSHAAGLMSEDSVWTALRVLRDTPGSPVLLVARGAGRDADRYALTTPAIDKPNRTRIERARVEPVHPAWSVLGLRGRTAYELVSAGHATNIEDVLAGARLRPSNGYDIIADLTIAGLIERHGSTLRVGTRSLDDVAASHGLEIVAADRIVRHRAERLLWQLWLDNRFATPAAPDMDAPEYPTLVPSGPGERDSEQLWAALMATGPPPTDPMLDALDLLAHELGAVIVREPQR